MFFNFFVFCQFELQGGQGFYLVGRDSSGFLNKKFQQLIGEDTATPQEVEVVMGRTLQVCAKFNIVSTHEYYYYCYQSFTIFFLFLDQVPLGANGCAYFPFEELCDKPLGAADYFGLFSKTYVSMNSVVYICCLS